MRRLTPLLFLLLIAAKGKKKEPVVPPPVESAAPAAPAAEEPPPAPPEPAAPTHVRNIDMNVSIAFADGTSRAGKVTGVERTIDFYGDEGWSADDGKLKMTVEANGTEKQVGWKDVKSISIVPGKIPDEVDCTYSSEFSPWMYECTLRTTTTATLRDGSKGVVSNRHRWRFTWEDGSTTEFSIFKYTVREQDDRDIQFGSEQTENFALYTRLQDKLRTDAKTVLLKGVTVQ